MANGAKLCQTAPAATLAAEADVHGAAPHLSTPLLDLLIRDPWWRSPALAPLLLIVGLAAAIFGSWLGRRRRTARIDAGFDVLEREAEGIDADEEQGTIPRSQATRKRTIAHAAAQESARLAARRSTAGGIVAAIGWLLVGAGCAAALIALQPGQPLFESIKSLIHR